MTVRGLPDGELPLRHYRIDAEHANAVASLRGRPVRELTAEQLRQIADDAQLRLLEPVRRVRVAGGRVELRFPLPVNGVSLLVLGDEPQPQFEPSPHIAKVIAHESAFLSARRIARQGQRDSAKQRLQQLVEQCADASRTMPPGATGSDGLHCFWGQKALFELVALHEQSGDLAAADETRQRLLVTTLNDIDRFLLLKARQKFVERSGRTDEAEKVSRDLETVAGRLKRLAEWSRWSR
ncbi:MAG TPA: hypothetical protein EYH34_06565 [Planctomycetes bacterium]|nr:hypothetical protein [Planctomycetota bacterium]